MEHGVSYKAPTVSLNVVAVTKPGLWVIRAISPFQSGQSLIRKLLPHVGSMDPELIWTGYCYEGWPFYVVYGNKEEKLHAGWPYGIYYFPVERVIERTFGKLYVAGDMILGKGKRIGDV